MRAAVLWTMLIASPSGAGDLLFPVDCALGESCFIQQYVDRDPGKGIADFTCGPLTYDGHRGTDIALPDRLAMRDGVDVLSASDGVVLGIRNNVPDHVPGAPRPPNIKGRECGNGVLVQRADGWHLQYCHLAEGSVTVRQGEAIEAGTILGQIGLSGRTQFPHLHVTIRDQAGRVIDPFDARQQDESCRLRDRRSLWQNLDAQDYRPGGILATGFAEEMPDYAAIKAGTAHAAAIALDAPAIVFWVHLFGLKEGDEIRLNLRAPDGEILASNTHMMTRNRARQFRGTGRRATGKWPPGTYLGEAQLVRDGDMIERNLQRIDLR